MTFHCVVAVSTRICNRKGEYAMNSKMKFWPIGLVLGGGIGIVVGALMDNMAMGIVFGGGFGLIIAVAIGAALDRRSKS
jgi:hypothetical protein